ncbi:unnamed protein product [Rotaria sp. Silwood2]|nr:unnamed protein product [Rotaria sp. Silwood2]CAF4484028.1 unnamed protein product [Rotaria sp. Silwood2]
MANSGPALDWAISQGANAIENDLHFDKNGNPTKFEHGGICDCFCAISDDHICNTVESDCAGSKASENVTTHLQHIARLQSVALIFIDSKVDARMGKTLAKAGSAVIHFLDKHLFANDYQGKIIISSAKIDTSDYLRLAAAAANSSSYKERYFFTFDQENNDYALMMATLSRFTNNRVYGTGTSSCLPEIFHSGIKAGVQEKKKR